MNKEEFKLFLHLVIVEFEYFFVCIYNSIKTDFQYQYKKIMHIISYYKQLQNIF